MTMITDKFFRSMDLDVHLNERVQVYPHNRPCRGYWVHDRYSPFRAYAATFKEVDRIREVYKAALRRWLESGMDGAEIELRGERLGTYLSDDPNKAEIRHANMKQEMGT